MDYDRLQRRRRAVKRGKDGILILVALAVLRGLWRGLAHVWRNTFVDLMQEPPPQPAWKEERKVPMYVWQIVIAVLFGMALMVTLQPRFPALAPPVL